MSKRGETMKIQETEVERMEFCEVCNEITLHLLSPSEQSSSCMKCGVEKINFHYQ